MTSKILTTAYNKDRTPRWLNDVTNDEHHSLDMVTASKIKYFWKKSPSSFYEKYILKSIPKTDPTEAMVKGTLFHMCILEPAEFKKRVYVSDESKNTKAFKTFVEKELDCPFSELQPAGQDCYRKMSVVGSRIEAEYFYFIKSEMNESLLLMRENVMRHKRARTLLEGYYETERSGVAFDKEHLMDMCIRPDLMRKSTIVDFKTIKSLDKKTIEYQMYDMGYFLQMAHYMYVANMINPGRFFNFIFVFVESVAPFEVCVVNMSSQYIQHADGKYHDQLRKLRSCMASDSWPRLDNSEMLTVEPPRWALYT